MRIAILREHMVVRTPNHEAISKQIDKEIKTVLWDKLGAEIVETITPAYPDDPEVPNLRYTLADAFSETLPRFLPELFSRKTATGELMFAVPGYDVTSYDYLLKLSRREAPLSNEIRLDTIASIAGLPNALDFKFEMDRYLAARGDRTITNWAAWVSHARFRDDATRAAAENWVDSEDDAVGRQGGTAGGQPDREDRPPQGDAGERHRPVRASGEHGADAQDSRPQCRYGEPRGDHPRPADSTRRRAGRLQPNRVRAAIRAQPGQDQLRLGPAAGDAAVSAAAPDADCNHVLRRTR